MRVLVVNAGSSSLKLSVLDDDRRVTATTVERWEGEGHLRPAAGVPRRVRTASTRSGTASCTAARGTPPRCASTTTLLAYLDSTEPTSPRCTTRGRWRGCGRWAGCSRTCRRSPASTPPSTPTCRRPPAPTRCPGVEPAVVAAALRLPRPLPRVRRAAGGGAGRPPGRGPAHGVLPPGRRRLAGGRAWRALGGHHDGLHPAGGAGDGDPVAASLDPGLLLWLLEHGGVAREALADVLEHGAGLKGLSGTSGDLRDVLAGRPPATRTAPWPSTSSSTGCAARSAR